MPDSIVKIPCPECGAEASMRRTTQYVTCKKCNAYVINTKFVISTFTPIDEIMRRGINKSGVYREDSIRK